MAYPVILSATLHATTDGMRISEGLLGWHHTQTQLILKDSVHDHIIEPLNAYGYGLPSDKLDRGQTYHIDGPFGQDLTSGQLQIQHSSFTQTEVGTHTPDYKELAGKAILTGVGKVLDVQLDNVSNDGKWHLTVNAQHQFYETTGAGGFKTFVVTYHFGHATPPSAEWKHIKRDSAMWLHGNVISKDMVTQRLLVQVIHHCVLGQLPTEPIVL
ncbi:hypothetical protein DFH28DRAFT_1141346 [Melampsora americana]|nr:hypothetical protein DFH28DRAFT_1141346 [Melampsora americana]